MNTPSPLKHRNTLFYAAGESDADIRYFTGFSCPDPFIAIRTASGRRIAVLGDLEFDRARATARVHRVLRLAPFAAAAARRRGRQAGLADTIREVLRALRIRSVTVPHAFPAGLAQALRARRIGVRALRVAAFPERIIKTDEEITNIRTAMRAAEAGIRAGINLLARSRIRGRYLEVNGRRLTADILRREVNAAVFARGFIPAYTIVAPGREGCDPHNAGAGAICAHEPVIIDVFPRSEATGYFGDITRTVVRGHASDRVRRMYRAVLAAQRGALQSVHPGVRAQDIHRNIHAEFTGRGFETGVRDGRMQGFFHGTGHGVGLEIHEPPRIADGPDRLRRGMVITIEPGLYYWPDGGVRIEDTVLVTHDGIDNLTHCSKRLEIL